MAKPRIFISSTCFDLNDIRSELTDYLEKYNFEVLNSQLKNFGVAPGIHSHSACLEQVENADFFIVILGGRRGGTFIGSEKSITNEEYSLAVKKGIPIMIFVNQRVNETSLLYKKNPTSDFSSVVEDNRIFHFIDYIKSSSEDNWVFQFQNVNDIKDTIKAQLSYYLLLFSQNQKKSIIKEKNIDSSKLAYVQFPSNLDKISEKEFDQEQETSLRNGIKELHKTIVKVLSSEGKNDNKQEKLKVLWVIAKYGEFSWDYEWLKIDNNLFKDYAWSTTKGKRVSAQCKPSGINYEYEDYDEEEGSLTIRLSFENENEDCQMVFALKTIVEDLIKKHQNDDAFELFKKADFRIYME
jgi:6-pyruvoyl-tetrahydropterin synthase